MYIINNLNKSHYRYLFVANLLRAYYVQYSQISYYIHLIEIIKRKIKLYAIYLKGISFARTDFCKVKKT